MELIEINNTIDNQVISENDVTISQGNFIEANKSSYIDSNLERNANAFEFVSDLANSMQNQTQNWFLS